MTNIKHQLIPIFLTILTFLILSFVLFFSLHILNLFPIKQKVQIILLPLDILVGMTIYMKTSIDFGIFMGNLMHTNPGWKKRIAIEIGTALGNGLGTFLVLGIWFFFKQAPHLLIVMILFASLILFRMAEEGLEETIKKGTLPYFRNSFIQLLETLQKINNFFRPVVSRLIPEVNIMTTKPLPFLKLLFFAFSIPFILGLDDFAGYIPLFTIVNIFSFIIGVFLGHMLLNVGLFAFPKVTTRVTRHPFMVIFGSLVFMGLAVWGVYEAIHIALTQLIK